MKKIGLMLLVSISWLLFSSCNNIVAQEETLTLLTYYPAPYGIYQTLEVLRQDGVYANLMISQYRNTNIYPMITFRKADNTLTSPEAVDDDERLGTIVFNGHDGTAFRTGAEINAVADADWGANERGTEIRFRTRDGDGSLTDRMTISAAGNVWVTREAGSPYLTLSSYDDDSSDFPVLRVRKADNTIASPQPIDNGDILGVLRFEGRDNNDFATGANIYAIADAPWGASERGTEIRFSNRDDSGGLTDKVYIKANGKVGIGEADPIGALHVVTTASATPAIRGESTWGSGLYAESTNYYGIQAISTATGAYSGNSIGVWGDGNSYDLYAGGSGLIHGTVSPFTGSHEVKFYSEDIEPGLIVVSTGECETRTKTFSDTIPAVELCQDVMDKRILGVFVEENNLDEKYWYKPKKGEKIGRVNALGDGLVLVTDANGPIENGDYITTSQIPGYGQKQDDDILHSYTLGKAIQSVDWDNITDTIEFNGKRYKKCLIAVTYHCG